MKTINLLPAEHQQAHRREYQNRKLVKFSVVILVALGAGCAVLWAWRTAALEAQSLMEHRVASLEANLEPFEGLRDQALLIHDRLTSYEVLVAEQLRWAPVYEALAQTTPADVQVQTFTPALSKTATTFTILGQAGSRAHVVGFKRAMEASGVFSAITFDTSQLVTDSSGAEQVSFTLTGTITPPASDGDTQ